MKTKTKVLVSMIVCICVAIGTIAGVLLFKKETKSEEKVKDVVQIVSASNGEETGAASASVKEKGGALYIGGGEEHIMSGGTISSHNNTYGGAIYIAKDGKFIMSGGLITDCEAEYGGAIYVEAGGTCIISGGEITGNRSASAAIFLEDGASLEVSSPSAIHDNKLITKRKVNFFVDGLLVDTIVTLSTTYTLEEDDYPLNLEECCGYFIDSNYSKVLSGNTVSFIDKTMATDGRVNIYTKKATVDEFVYTLDSATNTYSCEIDATGTNSEVVMPQKYNGLPVQTVNKYSDISWVTSVCLSAGVKNISNSAFEGLGNLTQVNIPSSLTAIGSRAFSGCTSLKGSITIPSGVDTIDTYAFSDCQNLSEINIEDGVKNIKSYAFTKCYSLTNLEIPESVTSIGNSTFSNCEGLTTVKFNDGLQTLGNNTFSKCVNLTAISLPDTLTTIGIYAFSNCKKLSKVVLPKSVTTINNGVFSSCSALLTLTIPINVNYVGTEIVYNCTSLETIYCEAKAKPSDWDDNWNYKCDAEVIWGYLATSVVNIYVDGEFVESQYVAGTTYKINEDNMPLTYENCPGYFLDEDLCQVVEDDIIYMDNVPVNLYTKTANNLGKLSFTLNPSTNMYEMSVAVYSISGELVLPRQYNDIQTCLKASAFIDCNLMTKVVLPVGLTTIPDGAFSECYGLTEINLLEGITNISNYALFCAQLNNVSLPSTLNTIGAYAFAENDNLKRLFIPESVTSIEENAFEYCANLEEIIVEMANPIYDSRNNCNAIIVTATNALFQGSNNMDIDALNGEITSILPYSCTGLKGITKLNIPSSVTTIGDHAFHGCWSIRTIDFGSGVTSIGDNAFSYCYELASLTIPGNVTTIGQDAFYNCTNLTNVVMEEGVTTIKAYAFSFCSALTTVILPDSMTTLYNSIFYACKSLSSLYIPSNVTTIISSTAGTSIFNGCDSTTLVYCEASQKPSTWDSYWNYYSKDAQLNVFWGFTREKYFEIFGPSTINIYVDGVLTNTITDYDLVYKIVEDEMPLDYEHCSGYFYDEALTKSTNGVVILTEDNGSTNGGNNTINIYTKTASSLSNFSFYTSGKIAYIRAASMAISGDLVIPKEYNGLTVQIADEGFYECENLTSVILPDGLTKVSYAAFYMCTGLISVSIPDSVTRFENSVFYNCTNLSDVSIHEGITNIGDGVFYQCYGLNNISIPESVISIGEQAFLGCINVESITVSEDNTVYDSRNNSNTIIETETNTLITGCAASNLSVLTNIKTIAAYAFSGCKGLTNISIPASVTRIETNAFQNCNNITSIVVSGDNNVYDSRNGCNAIIDTETNTLILGCASTDFSVLTDIEVIGDSAFEGCFGLSSIIIPRGVTTIGNAAFAQCTGLTSVVISDTVTTIKASAFWRCTSLISVYIPSSVTTIEADLYFSSPFYGCSYRLEVYCGASSKPDGWGEAYSNYGSFGKVNVNWNYTLENYYSAVGAEAFAPAVEINETVEQKSLNLALNNLKFSLKKDY